MGRASLKLSEEKAHSGRTAKISRPYGPGLIEASRLRRRTTFVRFDFPALWAGPH